MLEINAIQWGRVIEVDTDERILVKDLCSKISSIIICLNFNRQVNISNRALNKSILISISLKGILRDNMSLLEYGLTNGDTLIYLEGG